MIRIMLPMRSLYTFGPAVLHDMERRTELLRAPMGSIAALTAEAPHRPGRCLGPGEYPAGKAAVHRPAGAYLPVVLAE
ncbi:MAG: hypothetical protein IJA83_04855 [Clostridia bacterium]|nr:hypothetical protein [Clostridia bacterium]